MNLSLPMQPRPGFFLKYLLPALACVGLANAQVQVRTAVGGLTGGGVDFGTVATDRVKTMSLELHNAGSVPVTGLQASIGGAYARRFVLEWPQGVTELAAGATLPFSVVWFPGTAGGAEDARLELTWATDGALNVTLQGVGDGSGPLMRVTDADTGAVLTSGGLLDFGSAPRWQPLKKAIIVENLGTARLVVADITIPYVVPGGFTMSGSNRLGIAPGGRQRVDLQGWFYQVATSETVMTLSSNAAEQPEFALTLKRVTVPDPATPRVHVWQSVIDYGTVAEMSTSWAQYTIENGGTTDLTVQNIESVAVANNNLRLDSTRVDGALVLPFDDDGPFVLHPGSKLSAYLVHVGLTGSSSITERRRGTLRIRTDDSTQPLIELPVLATINPHTSSLGVWLERYTRYGPPSDYAVATRPWSPEQGPWLLGPVRAGQIYSHPFYLAPVGGNAHIRVESIEFEGPHAADFSFGITERGLPGRVTLPKQSFGNVLIGNLGVVPTGDGPRYARMIIRSDDPVNPRQVVDLVAEELPPSVSVSSGTTLDLGWAFADGGTTGKEVRVMNNPGGGRLDAVDFALSGADAASFRIDRTTSAMDASLRVTFAPMRGGAHQADLKISGRGTHTWKGHTVRLIANAWDAAPRLEVIENGRLSKAEHLFVKMGTAVLREFRSSREAFITKTVRLRNVGTRPITGAGLYQVGDDPAFSASFVTQLAAGAEADLEITFDPAGNVGPRSTVLRIQSANYSLDIPLAGTAAYGEQAQWQFGQANWVTTAMAALPDGRLVLAGHSIEGSGQSRRLRLISPDGSAERDIRASHDGAINSMAVLPGDGLSLIIAGEFANVDGQRRRSVARIDLAADGNDVLNAGFVPPDENYVARAVLALPDGKVIVGGARMHQAVIVTAASSSAGSINLGTSTGLSLTPPTPNGVLMRLNADGSRDSSFTATAPSEAVNALALQADGKVLVGGNFGYALSQPSYGPPTGLIFPGVGSNAPLPASEVLILNGFIGVGEFSGSSTLSSGALYRLNSDGTQDTSFPDTGFKRVTTLTVLGDRIAVGGMETRANGGWMHVMTCMAIGCPPPLQWWGSVTDVPVVRLLSTAGEVLAQEDRAAAPRAVGLLPGDRVLVTPGNESAVDSFQPRGAPRDSYGKLVNIAPGTAFATVMGLGVADAYRVQTFDGEIRALLCQPDGKVIVGGTMTAGTWRSTGGTLPLLGERDGEYVNPANFIAQPVAGVAQLDTDGFLQPTPITRRSDALTRLDFGETSSLPVTRSESFDNISFTRAWIDGPAAEDYRVETGLGSTHSIPGQSRGYYEVTFQPTRGGARRAVLHLLTDGLTDPLDIALEGWRAPNAPEVSVAVNGTVTHIGAEVPIGDGTDPGVTTRIPITLINTGAVPLTNVT